VTEISEVAIKYTLAVDCLGLPASGALDPHLDPQMPAAGTLTLLSILVQKYKYCLGLPASGAVDAHLDPQILAAGTLTLLALLVQKYKY